MFCWGERRAMLTEDGKDVKRRSGAAGNTHRWRGGEREGRREAKVACNKQMER